jgi:cytochrome d ubiquinol oxidase subunit II
VEFSLANIWLLIIGFFLLYYAVTDGFDLGVGILCLFSRNDRERQLMVQSLTNIWHTNQTWLLIVGGMLFGAFPMFYSVMFSAVYIPAVLMLVGLIFRGIAFDFSENSRSRRFWNLNFGLGSLIATLAQGFALGGLLSGISVKDGRFVGGVWDWVTPFTFLVTLGVVVGYLMLGANYLIMKTEGDLQKRSFRYSSIFSVGTLILSISVYFWINLVYPHAGHKWISSPDVYYVIIAPLLTGLGFFMVFRSLYKGRETAPLVWNAVTVALGFIGLSVSLYPHMIPHLVSPVTVEQAAASPSTLIFMFVVTGVLLPVILFYTTYTYRVFRGKVTEEESESYAE